jgi:hypothetical protein
MEPNRPSITKTTRGFLLAKKFPSGDKFRKEYWSALGWTPRATEGIVYHKNDRRTLYPGEYFIPIKIKTCRFFMEGGMEKRPSVRPTGKRRKA